LLAACRGSQSAVEPQLAHDAGSPVPANTSDVPSPTPVHTPTPTATPTAVPTPTPRPAGTEVRTLLPGTPWATDLVIQSSGLDGPGLMVLGGVHGNEPGGWHAADQAARWTPAAGMLIVVPRANVLAINSFLRLVDGEGDLNRQYPGDANSDVAMSRMAAEITEVAREFRPDVLLDLHESWAYFVDREAAGFQNRAQAGTAFLGQTLTGGAGPRGHEIAGQIAEIVNSSVAVERQLFIPRDGWGYRRGGSRGSSSLSLGGYVPGLTPVLVETAQDGMSLERRSELHLAVIRATMDILAI
jgi:hypothetical protein